MKRTTVRALFQTVTCRVMCFLKSDQLLFYLHTWIEFHERTFLDKSLNRMRSSKKFESNPDSECFLLRDLYDHDNFSLQISFNRINCPIRKNPQRVRVWYVGFAASRLSQHVRWTLSKTDIGYIFLTFIMLKNK